MRYLKRTGVFKGNQGRSSFDPKSMQAWSYDWWQFLAIIDGKVTFNNYYYSSPTRTHQAAVRKLLNLFGVKHRCVSISTGLQNIIGEVPRVEGQIETLREEIATPRSHARKNKERRMQIIQLKEYIKELKRLAKAKRSSEYKGKIDLSLLPKPTPLTGYQKDQREKQKQLKQLRDANRVHVQSVEANRGSFKLVKGGNNEF